jgi:uncharacterized phiE125 gp8 family phage protein
MELTLRRAVRTVAPSGLPLLLSEAKAQIQLPQGVTQSDELVTSCIYSAWEQWEADTHVVLLTSTWAETWDCWPELIELSNRPVASISSVGYVDSAGASQTLSSANYTFDAYRLKPAIFWKPNVTLPTLDTTTTAVNQVTVTYVAGYGAAKDVPYLVKQALKVLVSRFYHERTDGDLKDRELHQQAYERIRAKYERSSYP